jgi:hypothetical protein
MIVIISKGRWSGDTGQRLRATMKAHLGNQETVSDFVHRYNRHFYGGSMDQGYGKPKFDSLLAHPRARISAALIRWWL